MIIIDDDDGDDDVYSIAIHILLEHVSFARTSNFQICMSDLLVVAITDTAAAATAVVIVAAVAVVVIIIFISSFSNVKFIYSENKDKRKTQHTLKI